MLLGAHETCNSSLWTSKRERLPTCHPNNNRYRVCLGGAEKKNTHTHTLLFSDCCMSRIRCNVDTLPHSHLYHFMQQELLKIKISCNLMHSVDRQASTIINNTNMANVKDSNFSLPLLVIFTRDAQALTRSQLTHSQMMCAKHTRTQARSQRI